MTHAEWHVGRDGARLQRGSDVSLHCFPHEKKIRKQWEVACGRVQLPKDPRLCSRHFSPDAFEAFSRLKELTGAAGYKRRLKPNAVPSIFPHKEPKRPRITCSSRCYCRPTVKT
uniref:THAP-type domain-containing protein n=1 Tax=Esox lucius TaxID=8010 RepID=A0A3P8YMA7_ESOLU